AFEIAQVPRGEYVVLAAFENDLLVRDPDTSIGGTQLQHVAVDSGASMAMDQSFKITEHLAIVGPGSETPERVAGPVTFSWADDSSEDRYELELYTALGDLVWEQRAVPSVSGSDTVELSYAGPALTPGMVYQFRVTSMKDGRDGATALSKSEDLRGVFEWFAP
ncbi:MAG TPA: fibronectin type III domain-containing protein, partial [Polyangiaceae bacterium]|nr:fibronectin type III domain-containing protein [Polyangiaceae bacterium]